MQKTGPEADQMPTLIRALLSNQVFSTRNLAHSDGITAFESVAAV
jgi:hypothetical protein